MKQFPRICALAVVGGVLLTGCGSRSSRSLADVTQALESQQSVICTVKYTLTMDAQLDGTDYENVMQTFTAEVQTDLQSGDCHLTGELATQLGEQKVQHYDVEAYGEQDCTYYRYNDFYYAEDGAHTILQLVELPSSMADNGSFQRQDATELVYGAECDVFSGTGLTDDTEQAFYNFLVRQPIDLSGCAVDATLRAYRDTGLPANLTLEYNDLADLNIQIDDQNGNSYRLNTLRYEITYHNYGTEVDTVLPDDFREAALAGLPEDGGQIEPDELEGTYRVYNDTKDYFISIGTPEYMRYDSQSDSMLSFYYNYAENDTETIDYTLYNDYSIDKQEESAELTLEAYRKADILSKVSADPVRTITIGAYKVYYRVYQMTLTDETGIYKVKQIYSWMDADGNGTDSLAVEITEYNGAEDPTFIDTETELEYAYGVVYGAFDVVE